MTAAAPIPAAPRERPIIFTAESIRKILEGRKTQTRRIAKFKALDGADLAFSCLSVGHYCTDVPSSGVVLYARGRGGVWEQRTEPIHCPYGAPGEARLWVKETWWHHKMCRIRGEPHDLGCVRYQADEATHATEPGRWLREWYDRCPSVLMPRSIARITLEVVGVRVERLQAIPWYDIRAEGVACPEHDCPGGFCCSECPALRRAWSDGWDAINRKRAPWASDPWVWVVEFRLAVQQ